MGFDRFEFLPSIGRPPLIWPGRARLAFWLVSNVGHYEYLPRPDKVRDFWPRLPHPDPLMFGHYEYGNRVGFWRVLDVCDRYNIRPTAALGLAAFDHFPDIRDAMLKRDWGIMSHGIYPTRTMYDMSEEEERAYYQESIELLRRHTGRRLKGLFGPLQSKTERTPDLMAEAGLIYHADWFHDDQPFPMKVKSGRLISMPYTLELNDADIFVANNERADFVRIVKDQFDVLYSESEESGKVFCIAIHPYIIGQPHRIEALAESLEYVLSHDGVWCATGDQIAEYYLREHYDTVIACIAENQRQWLEWSPPINSTVGQMPE